MSKEKNVVSEALLKSIDADLDEITLLTKSYFEKVKKAEGSDEEEQSPVVDDAVEGDTPAEEPSEAPADMTMEDPAAAPEMSEESIESYVKTIDDSELKELLTALMDEYETRLGGGEEAPAEDGVEKADGLGLGAPSVPPAPMAPPMLDKAGEVPPMEDPGMADMPPEQPEEMPAEQPAPEAGAEAPNEDAVRQAVATLSPEEKQLLLKVLQEGDAGLATELPAGAPPAQKSMKLPSKFHGEDKAADGSKEAVKAFGALKKSYDELAARMAKLEKSVSAPADTLPTRQYASGNPEVRVLEKSEGTEGRMDGMTLANWLIGQQRQGNRLVKSMLVTKANLAKSDAALDEVYGELRNLGITPPK